MNMRPSRNEIAVEDRHSLKQESKKSKYVKLVVIAGLIIFFDQISKAIILDKLPMGHTFTVISGFFDITHIHNSGGAFGIFASHNQNLRVFLFLFVSSFATCFVLYFYNKTPGTHPMLATGFALIFGGAVGNLIDRIRFGEVIDFLDFYIGSWHWYTFNIADSAITVGVVIFLFHILLNKIPE
ncbi:signal peptidase II [Desulfococcaceae bacterium HSG8]|nr:signal peptidase II [Desulfococcaceae bacterium HSG8]